MCKNTAFYMQLDPIYASFQITQNLRRFFILLSISMSNFLQDSHRMSKKNLRSVLALAYLQAALKYLLLELDRVIPIYLRCSLTRVKTIINTQ